MNFELLGHCENDMSVPESLLHLPDEKKDLQLNRVRKGKNLSNGDI
jgi:hypothetical protein